jgi:hypothetical protein
MNARTASAYEKQLTQVFGKVKGASRGAWLAGLGAVARVQTQAPRYIAGLVRDGERFEGRAIRSAGELFATVKSSPGYAAVRKATRPYVGKLQKVYGETTAVVRKRIRAANGKDVVATAKRTVKRATRTATRRTKRAA